MNCARCLILFLAALCLCGAAPGRSVRTIDARTIEGRLKDIDSRRVIIDTGGGEETVRLEDVAEITFAEPSAHAVDRSSVTIVTTCGEKIPVEDFSLDGGTVTFTNALLGRATADLSTIKAIYTPSVDASIARIRARCEELLGEEVSSDVLVVAKSSRNWIPINGALEKIDRREITFSWKGAKRCIDRSEVRAIFPAGADSDTGEPSGHITGRYGTRIALATVSLKDERLVVGTINFGSVVVAAGKIQHVRFVSDRTVDLTDLSPVEVRQHGFLDSTFEYRRNRSVAGGPLRMDGREYAAGLGLHSFCRLTYRLEGGYEKFVAVVGIDDAARPDGDATIKFIADQEVLGRYRLTGKDKPQTVRLDITGAKEFIVEVGFGRDKLDVADHVDLAEARLIRRPEK